MTCAGHALTCQICHSQALQPGAETRLDVATLEAIAGDVPTAHLKREQVLDQLLVDVMIASTLLPNKATGKRMIKVCSTSYSTTAC